MKRSKIFILFCILQIVTLINMIPFYYKLAPHLLSHINIFDQNNIEYLRFNGSHLLLFLMILVSIFLYFKQNRLALRLYYFEFILRILLFTTTFGFLLKLNFIFRAQSVYNILVITVIVLEILRLITSVIIDIKWKKS